MKKQEGQGGKQPISQIVECAHCGSIGYDDESYCACCGTPRSVTPSRCPHCRVTIKHLRANYCPGCGARIGRGGDLIDQRA